MLHLSNSQAAELVERLYGLDVESVTDLDSYGDYNFHVKVSGVHEEHHGYVLKVMNAEDSRDEEQITAQTAMMTFLSTRGFPVQRLQQNRWGKVMSLETFQWKQHGTQVSSDHNVRLMTYLPGILGSDVTFDSKSLLAAGVYLARLHQTLQDRSMQISEARTSLCGRRRQTRQREGFESVRPLTAAEWDVLYPCVVGVACQLYVLNQHSISVDPGRAPYILKECGRIQETLKLLEEKVFEVVAKFDSVWKPC
ncbi:PREDICTED: hydroxylysine kinase-like [Branchiostoma belcheri]|uniref:Hydroxylysine kinase n=1 Tax=Branchiostoma belcheri TaxID=7741 RepID=A0A6P5ACT7_BRABE|nr:PREDICTED: hydroxylysine kinase-like [Branchiostoma belcheri]